MLALSQHSRGNHADGSMPAMHRRWRPREMVVREGDQPDFLVVITQGWAAKIATLPHGVRQITGLFLPGDVCELFWLEQRPVMQPVIALTELRGAVVRTAAVRGRADREGAMKDALWHAAQAEAEARCEWLVNVARRDAAARIAHIFCELLTRQREMGLTYGNSCDLPLTQHDLADLAGITPIHTNRTLQAMRADGLIELRGKRLRVLDLERLIDLAGFDPRYLSTVCARRVAEMLLSPAVADTRALAHAPPTDIRIG